MVAETNAAPGADEDIIELTEIIEQGPQTSKFAGTNAASPASLDERLNDLTGSAKNAAQDEEDNLDTVSVEIAAAPEAPPASPQTGAVVNPDADETTKTAPENIPQASAEAAAPSAADDPDALLDEAAPNPEAAPEETAAVSIPPVAAPDIPDICTPAASSIPAQWASLLGSGPAERSQAADAPEKKETDALQAHLQKLEERLQNFEIRLQKLESGYKEETNRAAAAAAARIIREELAALLKEDSAIQ